MARKLFLVYLAIMLGPLLLAMVAWAVRDAMKRALERPEQPEVGGNGSEEGLAHTVEEVRATSSED